MTKYMLNLLLIFLGKFISFFVHSLNLGNGTTWPGHIALSVNKNFIRDGLKKTKTKVIIIAGTNGKTTTAKMLRTILEKNGKTIIQNQSGANLLNGLASTLLLNSSPSGKITADYAIFEVDENALPLLLHELTPTVLVLLNLFRDQLDRYGEVRSIAQKWSLPLKDLSSETTVILNADDPEVAYLKKDLKTTVLFFSVDEKKHAKDLSVDAVDSVYCPNCQKRLTYSSVTFSHLGNWYCTNCSFKKPEADLSHVTSYPLSGTYNKYNTHASLLAAKAVGVDPGKALSALSGFQPAFGRQEKITIGDKFVQIFLSKNPIGFNESLRTIKEQNPKTILLLLNDRVADGKDVSWIWDIDFETLIPKETAVVISGERAYDMAVRIKYAVDQQRAKGKEVIVGKIEDAVRKSLELTKANETLYILPTYTAMLDARKILKGRKIL